MSKCKNCGHVTKRSILRNNKCMLRDIDGDIYTFNSYEEAVESLAEGMGLDYEIFPDIWTEHAI